MKKHKRSIRNFLRICRYAYRRTFGKKKDFTLMHNPKVQSSFIPKERKIREEEQARIKSGSANRTCQTEIQTELQQKLNAAAVRCINSSIYGTHAEPEHFIHADRFNVYVEPLDETQLSNDTNESNMNSDKVSSNNNNDEQND